MKNQEPHGPRFRDLEDLRVQYGRNRDIIEEDTALRQQRGYFLEDALYALLHWEGLNPRSSFRPVGEEIDGSFYLSHRAYLLEAKWRNPPLNASDVSPFGWKVSGKLEGTLGVFVSMSGYTKDAIPALQNHKVANILLFDQSDIEAVILHNHKFVEVLDFKIRQAAELGEIYVPFKTPQNVAELKKKAESVTGAAPVASPDREAHADGLHTANRRYNVQVFCEGQSDIQILSRAMHLLATENQMFANMDFHMFAVNSKNHLLNNLSAMVNLLGDVDGVLVVMDSDGQPPATVKREKSLIYRQLRPLLLSAIRVSVAIIIAEPDIEGALANHAVNRFQDSPVIKGIVEFTSNLTTPSPWEEAGRIAVRSVLASAHWDTHQGTVAFSDLTSNDARQVVCHSVQELRAALERVARSASQGIIPYKGSSSFSESEYSRIVNEQLAWYYEELAKLGWAE